MTWLRQLFKRDSAATERWRVLQLEVTSRCLLHCTFCPKNVLDSHWIYGDLPWSVFSECIAPHLSRFDLVYLQGWGEPLLHPQLFEMLRVTKAAGCQVGFTTCGSALDEANSLRLLEAGLDILSISFSGATPETHEALRVGSNFRQLVANVERITRLKKERALKTLLVEVHFLMLRANIHELPEFVRLAAALGADEAVATNVVYTPTRAIAAQRVFGMSPDPHHRALVDQAEREARRLGITLRVYPLTMDYNILECDARPTEAVYINHLGQVAPCVYLGLPVREKASRIFEEQEHPVTVVNFGNVCLGLVAAMQGAERAKFIGAFRARKTFAYSALALSAASGASQPAELPAPPPPCRFCYKMYGV